VANTLMQMILARHVSQMCAKKLLKFWKSMEHVPLARTIQGRMRRIRSVSLILVNHVKSFWWMVPAKLVMHTSIQIRKESLA
jgi:hypothetical protein